MDITKRTFNTLGELTGKDFGYLMSAEPAFKFEDGKRTETVIGTRVEIAIPGVDLLKVTVEQPFEENDFMGKPVTFEGFTARFYRKDKQIVAAPTAKAKKLVVYSEADLLA